MALSDGITALLTRSPGAIAVEQFRKLWLRLYPYALVDFVHRNDLRVSLAAVQAELAQIKTILATHVHGSSPTGGPTSVMAGVVPPVNPAVQFTDELGIALIVPGGVPQPIGNSISIQPSRVDPDPIATPPLDPSILL